MKKILTIALLSISLSGYSQTEKGDFVITPTVGWSSFTNYSNSNSSDVRVQIPISTHYYLSDKFAVGLETGFRYTKLEYFLTNNNYYSKQKHWDLFIRPELQYNFLRTRFTPFIKVNYGGLLSLEYVNVYFETSGSRGITITETNTYSRLSFSNIYLSLGLTYYVKQRFGLQLNIADVWRNDPQGFGGQINYLPINFGLQFIINNPRAEIESPRY